MFHDMIALSMTTKRGGFMRIGYLLVAVFFSVAVQASESDEYFPEQLTAQKLLYACASSSLTAVGRESRRYCQGFVSGVEETERLLRGELSGAPALICLPHGKNAAFYADIFIKHASRKGADLEQPAVRVVMEALEQAFRCK
ncbi:MAG: Rap1a/Tai family immunity protein [Halopseudomonas sp.]